VPDVEFYAYTKMVSMVQGAGVRPSNFTVIFSYGGKEDHLIDVSYDRHSQVFSDIEGLLQAGYIDASQDDSKALTPNNKVGLIYHGAKSKQWGKK